MSKKIAVSVESKKGLEELGIEMWSVPERITVKEAVARFISGRLNAESTAHDSPDNTKGNSADNAPLPGKGRGQGPCGAGNRNMGGGRGKGRGMGRGFGGGEGKGQGKRAGGGQGAGSGRGGMGGGSR